MVKSFFYDPNEAAKPKAKAVRAPISLDCAGCGLDRTCTSPRMLPYGKGELSIAVVAEAPGEQEDAVGIPLVGKSGQLLAKHFRLAGLDIDRDCVRLNVVQCRPPDNRQPTDDERACCRARWQQQLRDLKPDLIYAFGGVAIGELLADAPGINTTATAINGRVIPSPLWQAFVCCSFHPAYYLRERNFDRRLTETIRAGLDALDKRGPWQDQRLDESAFELVEDYAAAIALLDRLAASVVPVSFDYEATGLDPYEPGFKLILASFATCAERGYAIPLEHRMARWTPEQLAGVYAALKRFLVGPAPKIIQNWQYEELASRVVLGTPINNVVCDTMVREHVLDNRADVCGQEFQEYVRYGSTHKAAVNKADLNNEFLDTVARYGVLDARYAWRWKHDQDKEMCSDLEAGYALLHRCIPLFVTCKERGIPLDMRTLDELDMDTAARLALIKDADELPVLTEYRKKYGKAWQSTSNRDKQRLFFDTMGLRPLRPTDSGAKKIGKGTFEDAWAAGRVGPEGCSVDAETVRGLLAQLAEGRPERQLLQAVADESHLGKLAGYIKNFRAMADTTGTMHPSFLLHTAATYRTSSADPNFQNIPVRNPLLSRLRKALRPHAGHDWLLEMDFSGAEVRGYAIASKDEWLVDKVTRGVDFHKRYAALLYEIDEADVTKEQRQNGKAGLTFPAYYGSYPRGIAASNPQWNPLTIERVFKQFWIDQPGVLQWQRDTEQFYWDNGYLPYMTGFRPRYGKQGFLSHNDCCNYPIQGFACHRLLTVMLAVEDEMRRRGMKSVIVGQIHDSIIFSVVDAELDDLILLVQEIVKRPAWEWDTVVPWEAEFKVGRNMLEMQAV